MRTHNLKTVACYWDEVKAGNKTFEIRDDRDRSFQKGDRVELVRLREGSVMALVDTCRKPILAEITYVTAYRQKEGYVVFGIKVLEGGEA